jgi:hypothetical protein
VVVDIVEASFNVPFDDPLIWRRGPIIWASLFAWAYRVADMFYRIATAFLGAKSV